MEIIRVSKEEEIRGKELKERSTKGSESSFRGEFTFSKHVGCKSNDGYKQRGTHPHEHDNRSPISRSFQIFEFHFTNSIDTVPEAVFPSEEFDDTDTLEDFIGDLNSGIFVLHNSQLENLQFLNNHCIHRNQYNHQPNTSQQ